MIPSRHAPHRQNRPRRDDLPCAESRHCAHQDVREEQGFCGVRANLCGDVASSGRCGYAATVVISNHWHFLLWPERDGDLAAFMQRLDHRPRAELAGAPPRNWNRASVPGAVQVVSCRGGRALPERSQICGAERTCAGLVSRAEQWRWGSLWRRCGGECEPAVTLAAWPMPIPDWTEWVNGAEDRGRVAAVADQHLSGAAFRSRRLAAACGQATSVGIVVSGTGQAQGIQTFVINKPSRR